MALTFFSDQFGGDGVNDNVVASPFVKTPVGSGGGRMRYKRCAVDTTAGTVTNTDTFRFATFKSGDRIIEIQASADGTWSAGTMNLGLYASGTANDGAVVDADLFGSALDISTGFARTEVTVESAVLADEKRGKTLWDMAGLSADPLINYDIAGICDSLAGTGLIVLEIYYTAGD